MDSGSHIFSKIILSLQQTKDVGVVLILFLSSLSVNDTSSFGRSLLVACAPKFLINQPDLCQDIIHILQRRSLDSESTMRFGVVKAINKATKMNLNVLQHSALFEILKDSVRDKNVSNLHANSAYVL